MSKKLKILFVSHEASATGAPLFLLGLHRWLKGNMDFEALFLLKLDGSIAPQFSKQAKTYKWDILRPKKGQCIRFLLNRLRKLYIAILLKFQRFDIVYLNSSSCSDILPTLKKFGLGEKYLLHVHELDQAIDQFHAEEFQRALPLSDHFIAVSQNVRNSLTNKWNISAHKISLIHPCNYLRERYYNNENIRSKYNIKNDTFIIGGCGELGERKGTDLFIECARHFFEQHPDANAIFMWLGNCRQPEVIPVYKTRIQTYGLVTKIIFAGGHNNAGDYFNAYDLFLLTSREDPFPLVALENANAGNPIICFDRNNGCTEYVDDSCGAVVPYADVSGMATAMEYFYFNRVKLSTASDAIKRKVAQYAPTNTGNAIKKLLVKLKHK